MTDMAWARHLSRRQQQALLDGPAMEPPPGIIPNFTNPPNHVALGLGILFAVSTVAGFLIFCQLYSRIVLIHKVGVADYIAAVALGSLAAFDFFDWRLINSIGLFRHQWDIQLKEISGPSHDISAGSIVYGVVIMLLKVGILYNWTHIFVPRGSRNAFWWMCHIVLWINVAFYVTSSLMGISGCTPRERLWNPLIEGKCLDIPTVIIVSAFLNFFSDIIILLLPQKVIWGLHMSVTKKSGIAALFAVGVFATTCAGFRIPRTIDFANNADRTYTISSLSLWSIAEMTAGFFVLCLPTMPKLLKDSPWICKLMSRVKSLLRWTSATVRSEPGRKGSNLWLRPKPRRAPDASLFTDSSQQGFVPPTDVSNSSESDGQHHKSWQQLDHVDVVSLENHSWAQEVIAVLRELVA